MRSTSMANAFAFALLSSGASAMVVGSVSITVAESSASAAKNAFGNDETGTKIWDAGKTLSTILATEYVDSLPSMKVLELGSGTGVGGLTAAAANATVILTDGSLAVLPLLEANVRVNQLEENAKVRRLQWGDPTDLAAISDGSGLELDLVIGSDLLYAPEIFPDLLDTLEGLCVPARTEVLLCFPPRYTESIFFSMAEQEYGFEVDEIREVEPGLFAASMRLPEW